MAEHLSQTQRDKSLHQQLRDERKLEEQDYRQFERQLRADEKERKKIYKDTLDHQLKILELQKQKYGTMTYEEKRMNKLGLEHFKSNQPKEFDALIPGINNFSTVGSSPLRRGGATQVLARAEDDARLIGASQSAKMLPQLWAEDAKSKLLMAKAEGIDPDKYNPITNPIPWVNQNPYVSKEKGASKRAASTLLIA